MIILIHFAFIDPLLYIYVRYPTHQPDIARNAVYKSQEVEQCMIDQ